MRTFLASRSGSVAIEFAIVGPILIVLVLAIVELSFKALQQTELDNLLMFSYNQLAKSSDGASDRQAYLQQTCSEGGAYTVSCDKIIFGTQVLTGPISDQAATILNGQWDYGCADDTIMIEMLYPATNILHSFNSGDIVTIGGTDYIRSRGLIRREPLLENGAGC